MKIKKGASRICILIGRYAIKIPHRIIGRLHNQDEVCRYDKRFNPYLYASLLFGLIVVWDRCIDAPFEGNDEYEAGEKLYKRWKNMGGGIHGEGGRPEKKRSSFGLSRHKDSWGKLVAIDFAPLYTCRKCRKNCS